jgi:hypothetical protein
VRHWSCLLNRVCDHLIPLRAVFDRSSRNNQQPNIPVIVGTIQAYFWGVAICFFVNLFVCPVSCETVLRSTMVSALRHMDTLSRLLLQSYSAELTESDVMLQTELVGHLRVSCTNIVQRSKNSQTSSEKWM